MDRQRRGLQLICPVTAGSPEWRCGMGVRPARSVCFAVGGAWSSCIKDRSASCRRAEEATLQVRVYRRGATSESISVDGDRRTRLPAAPGPHRHARAVAGVACDAGRSARDKRGHLSTVSPVQALGHGSTLGWSTARRSGSGCPCTCAARQAFRRRGPVDRRAWPVRGGRPVRNEASAFFLDPGVTVKRSIPVAVLASGSRWPRPSLAA